MIAWTDVETTGLDARRDHLLEVALVITDDNLNEVAAYASLVLPVGYRAHDVPMDDYVRQMHTKNGLLEALKNAEASEDYRHVVEQRFLAFAQKTFANVPEVPTHTCGNCGKNERDHEQGLWKLCRKLDNGLKVGGTPPPTWAFAPKTESALRHTPLAGSTVSFDRNVLREHMPKLEALFSYRSIDVSSLTELAKRWAPEIYAKRPGADMPKEDKAHRALADVRESIGILKYYVETGFILRNRETVFTPTAA